MRGKREGMTSGPMRRSQIAVACLVSAMSFALGGCGDDGTDDEPGTVIPGATTEEPTPTPTPTESASPTSTATTTPTPTPTPTATATATATVEATPVPTPKATPKPTPKATPKPKPAVYYANCTEVREAGADPIRRGQPGYGSHLDRDGDGIACET